MDLAFFTHFLNGLLMAGIPIGLGVYLTRRFKLGWRLWWLGAAGFVLSQVGHIPFNWIVTRMFQMHYLPQPPASWHPYFNPVFLGLSAGLFEELARAVVYRWWADDARSWRKGLLLGAGHGGIEAIFLSGLTLYAFIQMAALRNVDMSTVVPAAQVDLARQQMAAYWSTPWTVTLLGTLERIFSMTVHISLSVLVLQAFTRRQPFWIALAVIWHAISDGVMIYLQGQWAGMPWRVYAVEGAIGVTALISLIIIFALRQPEPVEPQAPVSAAEPQPVPGIKPEALKIEPTQENLDKSRYIS